MVPVWGTFVSSALVQTLPCISSCGAETVRHGVSCLVGKWRRVLKTKYKTNQQFIMWSLLVQDGDKRCQGRPS